MSKAMKSRLQTFLSCALLLAMIVGLLTACTKDNAVPTSTSALKDNVVSTEETEDNGDRLAMGWLTKDLGSAKNPANLTILSRVSETVETKTGSYYTSFLVSNFAVTEANLSDVLESNEATKDWARTASYEETANPRLFSASPNETAILITHSVTANCAQPNGDAAYVKIGFTTDSANVKGAMSVQADFIGPMENGIDQTAMYEILKGYVGDKLANLLVYMRDLDKVDKNQSQLGEASCYEEVDGGNGVYVIERYVDYDNGYDVSAVHFKVHIEESGRNMAYDLSPVDSLTKGDDARYDVGSLCDGRLGSGRMYTYQDSMKEYFALGTIPYETTGITHYEIREDELIDGTTDYFVFAEFAKGSAERMPTISIERKTNEDETGVVKSYDYKISGVIDVIPAEGYEGGEDAAYTSLIDTASKQLSLIFGTEVPLEQSYFSPAGDGVIAADLTILFAFSGDTIPAPTHVELMFDKEADAWTGSFRIEGANTISHNQ